MAASKSKAKNAGGVQLPLFPPNVQWSPPDMATLPEWGDAPRVGFDLETRDPQLTTLGIGVRRGGYVVGFAIAIEGGPELYLPIRHQGGDNLPEDAVLRYMRAQAAKFRGAYVGANLSYDLDYAWQEGVYSPEASYYDIQVADPLIYELHRSYSLKAIGARYSIQSKDEAVLRKAAEDYGFNPKSELWRLPARYVAAYAARDAATPLAILRKQEERITSANLTNIWQLESQVLPILVKLRRRGVAIDFDKLDQIEQWSLAEERKALDLVHRETGHHIETGDVYRSEAFAPALRILGIEIPKTAQGNDSIDKSLLSAANHPVTKALLRARKVNKLRTTFATSVREYAVAGRIHPTFNQIAREDETGQQRGARFGRMSCVDPNLQQQPSRDEFAKDWRSIYIPEPGALFGSLDYSQQEPRWTTHFAALSPIKAQEMAKAAAQAYWDDPLIDNHAFMAQLTGLPRKYAKNIYLGLCYGEGGAKLCRELQLPTRWAFKNRTTSVYGERDEMIQMRRALGDGWAGEVAGEEGQGILDTFDAKAPFIRQLAKLASKKAANTGQIRTILGRRLNFPEMEDGSYDWTHKALNRLIQGSSADQMKKAMVEIDRAMPNSFIQLQVHDELDGSFADRQEAEMAAEIMRTVIPNTKVPFRVDVEMGQNWGYVE